LGDFFPVKLDKSFGEKPTYAKQELRGTNWPSLRRILGKGEISFRLTKKEIRTR